MRASAAYSQTLEDVEVECTHCGVRMSTHLGSGQRVRYFRCAGCHRWVSSSYTEIFEANGGVRRIPKAREEQSPAFEQVKDRLERWLAAVEDQDPYRLLGVSPVDSPESIRERYRELALANHPDRGGSAEKMRELNLAYERILRHRDRRKSEALGAGQPPMPALAGNSELSRGPGRRSPPEAVRDRRARAW